MRSICLLGVQVAVKEKGWMVLAIDKSDSVAYFERKGCEQRNLDLSSVS